MLGQKAKFCTYQGDVHAIAPTGCEEQCQDGYQEDRTECEAECQDDFQEENAVAMINATRTNGRGPTNSRKALAVRGSGHGDAVQRMLLDTGAVVRAC